MRHARTIVLALALGGCGRASTDPRPNLLLVSIDTLRADRLGCYGYDRPTSPRIDAFAERGALFENAVAESSWTLPSHVTMLTGLYPSSHGVDHRMKQAAPGLRFVAQELQDAGYATLGLTEGGYLAELYGFARGFETFDGDMPALEDTLERAERFVAQRGDRPFFAFLHTYAVHCPYDPPERYGELFRSPDAQTIETAGKCGNPDYNSVELEPSAVRHVSDQYDASIREVDDLLGAFLDRLGERGLLEHTLVVVTSDHGEELHEHGRIGHEGTLYVETLRVPLVLAGPGVPAARVAFPVGLVDIAPTLLAAAGVPAPEGLEGRSLLDVFRPGGDDPAAWPETRVSELSWRGNLRSVWTPSHQLILDTKSREIQLFDLRSDPTEQDNLAAHGHERIRELARVLSDYEATRRERRRAPAAELEELPAEQVERLRALGYTESE